MKKSKFAVTVFCALLALAVSLSAFSLCFAASPKTVVSDYSVSASKISNGKTVTFTFYLNNIGMKTSELSNGKNGINVTHLTDSFSGQGTPTVSITSEKDEYLAYSVTFSYMTYKGVSDEFSFIVTYEGTEYEAETLTTAITECAVDGSDSTTVLPDDHVVLPSDGTEPTIPTDSSTLATPAPTVRITRGSLSDKLGANDKFVLYVIFASYGSTDVITGGTASFEPSEALILDEYQSSKSVPEIMPDSSQTVSVKLKVASEVAAPTQSVTVTYSYNYNTSQGIVSGTYSEKLLIPVKVSSAAASDTASATPGIIVTDYSCGGKVSVGKEFTLNLTFKNTSDKLGIDNIKMTVDSGDSLSVVSSSNSFFFSALPASASESKSIKMKVSPGIIFPNCNVTVSFSYEYVDEKTRSSGSATEQLSIPVEITDRFTLTPPDVIYGMSGEELTISVAYNNKSRSTVYNTEAKIVYDEESVFCELPTQNLGNIEAGKSGTIDFYVIPNIDGNAAVTVVVTYENESEETKTVEIPVSFNVDPAPDYGFEEPITEPTDDANGSGVPTWIIVVAAAVVLLAVVLLIKKKRKKKKKAASELPPDFDWSIDTAQPSPETQDTSKNGR